MDNYDQFVIVSRQETYHREVVFERMIIKHASCLCQCYKSGKICQCSGLIDLSQLTDINYIKTIRPQIETFYNIAQSITQSMRASSGSDFEDIIEGVFKRAQIDYKKQVFISEDGFFMKTKGKLKGHRVDFVIPSPIYGTHYSQFNGEIVSVKTSLRERFLQDAYLGKITLVSLEKCDNSDMRCVQIDPISKTFTKWVETLKLHYSKLVQQ